ncbi:MAG: hypothetical protein M1825_004046 [Sarcosagium campestre]|nr:MAG: hypothetical protein M1825_004046 [Sarcosagium campestre]
MTTQSDAQLNGGSAPDRRGRQGSLNDVEGKAWDLTLQSPCTTTTSSTALSSNTNVSAAGIAPMNHKEPCAVPDKHGSRLWRNLRLTLFSYYRRIFTIVFITNLAVVIGLAVKYKDVKSATILSTISTAASANLMAAVVFRHEHLVNLLFKTFGSVPKATPLCIRRPLAKVFHYGGLHSGCGVATVAWFIFYTVMLTRGFVINDPPEVRSEPGILVLTYLLLLLLVSIVVFAHPRFRHFAHNSFEAVHRFAGWTGVALLWIQTVMISNGMRKSQLGMTLGQALVETPSFWLLITTTLCIVYPWTHLRKVSVRAEYLSSHAVRLHFDYARSRVGLCTALRVSDNPLKEWHVFATIPSAEGSEFSLLVSRAGDWSSRMIKDPPSQLWVRGVPTSGFLRCAIMFRRVVIVATGSGIGPVLSLMIGRPDLDCRVLWSTRHPQSTYGSGVMDAVLKADPAAMIIDTNATGRPDLVGLAYRLYCESQAEAVFVISNPASTRKVVYGMESRGIPAYGPIWDS